MVKFYLEKNDCSCEVQEKDILISPEIKEIIEEIKKI